MLLVGRGDANGAYKVRSLFPRIQNAISLRVAQVACSVDDEQVQQCAQPPIFSVMLWCASYGFACMPCAAAGGTRRGLQLQFAATFLFCRKPRLCLQLSEATAPVAKQRVKQSHVNRAILLQNLPEKLPRWRTFCGLK